jgi:hypothetical protein
MRRPRRAVILALLAIAATAVFAISASADSLGTSNFEIDNPLGDAAGANLKVDAAGKIDWASVTQLRTTDAETGQNDDSYAGGEKEDDACPKAGTGSIPNNKSDLLQFGAYKEAAGSGPGFLHVYWTRVQDPSGTTNMDFEFNKSTADCDGAGTSKNVTRTAGDILLQFDVDKGGKVAQLSKRTWSGTAWSDPPVDLDAAGGAIGAINQVTIPAAESDGLGDRSARTFGEASFDLSRVFDSTKCESFGSAMLKSRSSDQFNSALKDFIAPIPVNIQNCGKVIIRKVTSPAGNAASFSFTKAFSTDPASANDFSLTGASPNNVKTFDGALLGAGSVAENTPLPTGWEYVSIDCSASTGVTPAVNNTTRTASWTIDAATDIVDCTYTNRLAQGAIVVTKNRKHAADGPGAHPQAGVSFTVNGVTKTTGTDGKACFDQLPFGAGGPSYNVTETLPAGYQADGALTKAVNVTANATCSPATGTPATVSFGNTPLTDLTITINSQVDGGTASTVNCTNGGPTNGSTGTNGDGTFTSSNLPPKMGAQAIVCTIVIDP